MISHEYISARGLAVPGSRSRLENAQEIDGASGNLIDDGINRCRSEIESRQRRHDDGAGFGDGRHHTQMPEMQWRLSGKEQERPPLFEMDVGYSGMAFQIAAAIILGVFLGKWLDKVFSTKFPLFTTIFSILGVFAGVFITIRDLLKEK